MRTIKVNQPELLTRSDNYYNFLDGWCEAGGHHGPQTIKEAWTRAKEIYSELGRKVSWYGLGYTMYISQQDGRRLERKEIKQDEIPYELL